MTRIKAFARKHRLALEVAGVVLALALLGIVIGVTVCAVVEACGLTMLAVLLWLLSCV
ncbi:hypothetical protein OZX67_03750 [Bifidobacterium sp. ESL0728]|uniref:hypothetical protein n=1 Tax=Bifidobacterium sp. ESL0728 TaxID=2983220 RepID=UPI0023F8CC29|nr:hypothetical protein [Bifidobacterium sp. ESL0728]WEV59661.1 hypothetical protein OZX67_03750 [Bifidobacterium sp. ESL0728]